MHGSMHGSMHAPMHASMHASMQACKKSSKFAKSRQNAQKVATKQKICKKLPTFQNKHQKSQNVLKIAIQTPSKFAKLRQKIAFSRNQFLDKGIDSLKQKTYRATPRILLRTSNKCILTFRGGA